MTVKNGMMLWTDAYLADTGHLTTLEHGAYLLILMAMWRSPDGKLPNNKTTLRKCAKLTAANWRHVERVVVPLLTVTDGGDFVSQKRLMTERAKAIMKTNAARIAIGRRWGSKPLENNESNDTDVSDPNIRNGIGRNTPNPNPRKKEEDSPPAPPKTGGKRATPRVQMPEHWQPTEDGFRYASERGFAAAKTEQMVRACRDYHIRRGTLIAGERGLAATWRTWVENEIKFTKERSDGTGRRQRPIQDDSRSLVKAADRLIEQAERGEFVIGPRPGRTLPAQGQDDVRLLPPGRRGRP